MVIIAIVFAVYLLVMVGIGIKYYSKSANMTQYVLGGRQIHPWVAAMSAQATDMSGWLLMGLPGLAYALYVGTSEAIWTCVGLWIGTYINWLVVAKRLRIYTEAANNSLTLPDFFENRFADRRHALKVISSIVIVIIFLLYMSAQFAAGGKLFSTIFGIPYMWGVIIGAVIILIYTALGGFTAVCWTDTVQGTIMFFALIIVPMIGVAALGGFDEFSLKLSQLSDDVLTFFPMADGKINGILLSSALGWGLGYFGHPGVLARFMSINSPEEVKISRRVAMVWVSVTMAAAVIIGLIGKALMPDLADPENVFIQMLTTLCHPVIAGILLTSVLAAIMSTASSQLLV
nr:sodium/proline symporter [Clostridia bacterium]